MLLSSLNSLLETGEGASRGAVHNDARSGGDHGSGGGGLLAHNTVAGDMHVESGGVGLLDHLAHGKADQ